MAGILDWALGAKSKVRLLRALSAQPDRWASEAELSREVRMSPNTVNLALGDLVRSGLLERQAQLVRWAAARPLAQALEGLFRLEDAWIAQLRAAARQIRPVPTACILFGSAARGEMGPHSDVDLLIVATNLEAAAAFDVRLRVAADGVCPGPLNSIHLRPADIRARAGSPLLEAIRREGILLVGKAIGAPA